MRLLARLSDLVSVNLHALLDKAEDPERMLAHLIRNMTTGLLQARQRAVQALVAERQIARELDRQRTRRDHWHQQALFALKMGRDDLARQAVGHKIDHDGVVCGLEKQHQAAHELCLKMKAALAKLQQRLAEARGRQSLLLARQRSAQVRAQVEFLFTASPESSMHFELLEQRLDEREDELLALVELNSGNDEFDDPARTKRIEEELHRIQTTDAPESKT